MSEISAITSKAAAIRYAVVKEETKTESNFSKLLADALEKELQEKAVMVGKPSADGMSQMEGLANSGGIEQLILTAASTGEVGDAEIALFMLCLMMENEASGDLSPLLGAMSEMLNGIKGDTEPLREKIMGSSHTPYVLDTVDREVFKNTEVKSLPSESWKPVTPGILSDATNRNPQNLRAVLDQFGVESTERYRPYRYGRDTYCNIFVWDATRALGCEIPHYVDANTGEPRSYPDIKGARELGANATHDWLLNNGQQYGWREVSAEQAQAFANAGYPAVTAWKNPSGGSGHVQMVCPSKDGQFDPIRGVTVTQAGAKNYNYTHISSTFSSSQLKNVHYFVHD